jgi:isopentenyl phosphate kinase
MKSYLALIKLGGSVITFKDKPLTANYDAIEGIVNAIALLKEEIPIILVHGGGSFGHYLSVKYDMHTRPDNYDMHGISVVHQSMISLNDMIVNLMIKKDLNPYAISPIAFTSGKRAITKKIKQLYVLAENGLIPVTFGDIIHINNRKYSILSGDVIMTMIAEILNPSKVLFTVNTDGIYKDLKNKEIVRELTNDNINNSKLFNSPEIHGVADITGGMRRKVTEAFKISAKGTDVMIVNGLKPERILHALSSKTQNFQGTIVKSRLWRRKN